MSPYRDEREPERPECEVCGDGEDDECPNAHKHYRPWPGITLIVVLLCLMLWALGALSSR